MLLNLLVPLMPLSDLMLLLLFRNVLPLWFHSVESELASSSGFYFGTVSVGSADAFSGRDNSSVTLSPFAFECASRCCPASVSSSTSCGPFNWLRACWWVLTAAAAAAMAGCISAVGMFTSLVGWLQHCELNQLLSVGCCDCCRLLMQQ